MDPEVIVAGVAAVLALIGIRRRAGADPGQRTLGRQVDSTVGRVAGAGGGAVRWAGRTATSAVSGATELAGHSAKGAVSSVVRLGGQVPTSVLSSGVGAAGRLAGGAAGLVIDGLAAVAERTVPGLRPASGKPARSKTTVASPAVSDGPDGTRRWLPNAALHPRQPLRPPTYRKRPVVGDRS